MYCRSQRNILSSERIKKLTKGCRRHLGSFPPSLQTPRITLFEQLVDCSPSWIRGFSFFQEEYRLLSDLRHLQSVKDAERKQMVDSLALAEHSASHLIQELLEMNEQAKKREAVIEKLEREADEHEKWLIVRNEESAGLRKTEILGEKEKKGGKEEEIREKEKEGEDKE